MIAMLQRALARVAAVAALLLGAALAVVLGLFTLLSGLAIGLVAAIAAWFGARGRRSASQGPADGPFGRGSAGSRPGGAVIDVEMREIEPGSTRSPASEPKESERSRSADDPGPDRPQR
ncbi:hypothetical protein [Zeimonas arvi]|uniref:Uncharacterized protein n=1 Tax=Zeimonas arvi TaxID=2498847 RepID=A0A5C8P074_9BURK|nr:hypothetical protein [Zeimonas arvi]TXL66985.1 hypothetical protein FHP08_05000 [Zeimonas arvi]